MTLFDEELRCAPFGVDLRPGDKREVMASGEGVEEAIAFGIEHSIRTRAVYGDGELLAMWGYRPVSILGAGCFAWMLSCPAIDRHKIAVARQTRRELSSLLVAHSWVAVSVDRDYWTARRWLDWLGFRQFGEREVNGVTLFDMIRTRDGNA